MWNRRRVVTTVALAALQPVLTRAQATGGDAVARLQRGGGLVVAMRHALAPGVYDPPGFRAGDCATQRNLSDEGREQARRIGAWYRARGLAPTAVRSSAWCRCLDTARLAFGSATPWSPLDSIAGDVGRDHPRVVALRDELARLGRVDAAGFEVWVTHQFNIQALVGESTASGAALLLRHDAPAGRVVVLGTLPAA